MAKQKRKFGIVDVDDPYHVLLRVEAVSPAQAIAWARFVLMRIRSGGHRGVQRLPRKAIGVAVAEQMQAADQPLVYAMRLVALTADEEQELLALPPAELREKLVALEREQRPVPGGRREKERKERAEVALVLEETAWVDQRVLELMAQPALRPQYDEEPGACCVLIGARRRDDSPEGSPLVHELSYAEARRRALAELDRRKRWQGRRRGSSATRDTRSLALFPQGSIPSALFLFSGK